MVTGMLSFRDFDIHLLSGDEMWAAMESEARPDMFENTLSIADSIEPYHLPRNLNLLPVRYRKPDDKPVSWLWMACSAWSADKQEYIDRLDEELAMLLRRRSFPYFLMVQNVVSWPKGQGIPCRPRTRFCC